MLRVYLTAAALALSVSVSAAASDREVESLQQALLQTHNELFELEARLNERNGEIERLNYELTVLREENAALRSRLAADSGGGAVPAGDRTAASGAQPAEIPQDNALPEAGESARREYAAAGDLLAGNELENAEKAFESFVNTTEENSLTPDAWYWLGEIQYKLGKSELARVSFINAAAYAGTGKRAEALYKLGLIYKASGDGARARQYFELVIRDYPGQTPASLAERELD